MAQQSHFRYVAQDYFRVLSVVPGAFRIGRPVCQDCTFSAVHQTGVSHDQADDAAASSHDRRHDDPQHVAVYPKDLRYTHRVAIGNSRLVALTDEHVSFRWKDYRENGGHKNKVMKLAVGEFMRRFLLHVLPDGIPPHTS